MDIREAMEYASRHTRIIRARKHLLYTFGSTRLPYICLSCPERGGDEVVVRRGEVTAEPPRIALPGRDFQFEGFDFKEMFPELDDEDADGMPVFIARRIEMPPARYVNRPENTSTEPGGMSEAVERAVNRLEQANDIRTAVISAPERFWNVSVLLYVGTQVIRSAPANVAEHLEHRFLRGGG